MKFSIDAGTFTLMPKKGGATKNYILNKDIQYEIPIFQRPYSWTEGQIKKFISDIFISFWGYNKNSAPDSMFIGTMQLSTIKNDNSQDIIDGQQRLSTFLILLKVLSLRYPDEKQLETLSFDWLITKVNNGEQQNDLTELIELDNLASIPKGTINKYLQNAKLIADSLEDLIELTSDDDPDLKINDFLNHLFHSIYFVVIQTEASLSKTLQIFDAINTTGLDLNAGDVFKIRMYEYLTKSGEKEEVFNEISQLYERIDQQNKSFGKTVTDIRGILGIYQQYLIARYNLPVALYTFGTDTFFERLFETLFNINKWEHFKNKVEGGKVKLSLEELNDIIDVRFEWEDRWLSFNYGKLINKGLLHLWWGSRYGRFWNYIFLFLFNYKNDLDRYEKLYGFTEKLVKAYLIYSLIYQRSVNKVKGQFNNDLLKLLIHEDYEDLIFHIDKRIPKEHDWERNKFDEVLSGDITYNYKVKNIICRLSALLEEDYSSTNAKLIETTIENLFVKDIDIEHIQSFQDEDESKHAQIHKEWGSDINSIGNLVVLERRINRSINNREHKKLQNYQKSKHTIVNTKLVNQYKDGWNLEKCKSRKIVEVRKIKDFLFTNS